MENLLSADIRNRYLEGLRNYKNQGVVIKIDGKEVPEENWNIIFKVAETPGNSSEFYMADFIAPFGKIREIHLDKIRVHDLDKER